MSKVVITTVGTSLGGKELLNKNCRDHIDSLSKKSNFTADDIINMKDDSSNRFLEQCIEYLNNSKRELKDYSAEIASLKLMDLNGEDKVILLCSDTPDGAFCGLVDQKYISETMKISCELKIIDGLEASEGEKFLSGLKNVAKETKKIINENSDYNEVIINITGGFKGAIPMLTVLATAKNFRIYYLHMESSKLIRIDPKILLDNLDDDQEIERAIHIQIPI